MAKGISVKRPSTSASKKDKQPSTDKQTKKDDQANNDNNDSNPKRGRRPPPPPLFRFYKISRLHRLHPWVNHHTTFARTRAEGTGHPGQQCSGVASQLKAFLRCGCCPSKLLRVSFLEYKDEITMAVQSLCILLGFLFLLLAAATKDDPTETTNDPVITTPAMTTDTPVAPTTTMAIDAISSSVHSTAPVGTAMTSTTTIGETAITTITTTTGSDETVTPPAIGKEAYDVTTSAVAECRGALSPLKQVVFECSKLERILSGELRARTPDLSVAILVGLCSCKLSKDEANLAVRLKAFPRRPSLALEEASALPPPPA
ncbi:uncharacterized protein LOC119594814 [Penaeus monodon]|uniref:uncharacterized protein LOC119594814 n=1 Tax=Penaeus monodon TaxID=6687 RepID=UPI0018A6F37D|nr:uncharacterized protein LOC119594814 [Penaeus monodon]